MPDITTSPSTCRTLKHLHRRAGHYNISVNVPDITTSPSTYRTLQHLHRRAGHYNISIDVPDITTNNKANTLPLKILININILMLILITLFICSNQNNVNSALHEPLYILWLAHGEVYSMQHYVMIFVSDIRQVCGFLVILRCLPPIKLIVTILLKYCWKVALNIITLTLYYMTFQSCDFQRICRRL